MSSKTEKTAQILSFVAAFGCIFMAVPAVLIGAIAKSTDWNQTDYAKYGPVPIPSEDYKLVLPLVLQYLCPPVVGVIGENSFVQNLKAFHAKFQDYAQIYNINVV